MQLRAIVRGRVQGVGFRAQTKWRADELKLVGYVCNLADGTVEICAEGERVKLEQLLQRLRKDFLDAIHDIDTKFVPSKSMYDRFSITRGLD